MRRACGGGLGLALAVAVPWAALAQSAELRVLDVLTATATTTQAPVGRSHAHGPLQLMVRSCGPARGIEGVAAYVQVDGPTTASPDSRVDQLFSGWLFSASPGLHAMAHPRYDVTLLGCGAR